MEVGQCPLASKDLTDVLNRPGLLVEDDNYDNVLRALSRQAAYQMDRFVTDQVSISGRVQ